MLKLILSALEAAFTLDSALACALQDPKTKGSSMSVRREVVSLSQLLRRNENSSSCRGTGRTPPLPLQTSRRRSETPLSSGSRNSGLRQSHSAPLKETPASSGYQSLSHTQFVRDANRTSTSQSEFGASSQTSNGFPSHSQEVYEAESESLSAMTSMSQSSFSQTQSQNLLGSSQDDQMHRLQQWQAQQAPPPAPLNTTHCNSNEKLKELERNLTKTFLEQIYAQKQHQQELMTRFASPIKKSVEVLKAKLATNCEDHQQQRAAIAQLVERVDGVAESVKELRQQSLTSKTACGETRAAVINEAAAVKAALTELQTRIGTVEGSVKSCSSQVSQALERRTTTDEALLSAVAASSCNCPQEPAPAQDSSDAKRATRKRQRSSSRGNVAESDPACYTSSSSADEPLTRTRTRSSPRCGIDITSWYSCEDDEMASGSLHLALQRIETLRSKRRLYQLEF